MRRFESLLTFAVAATLGASALARPSMYEPFNSDPGWDALNNLTGDGQADGTQNYGFQSSDNTGNTVLSPSGATSAGGEMGGFIQRDAAPPNYYGVLLPTALNPTGTFSADGVVHLVSRQGGSGYYLGFFNGASSYGSGGDANNFMGVQWNDSQGAQGMIFSNTGGRDRTGVDPSIPTGETVPWKIDVVGGSMVVTINGVAQGAISSGGSLDPLTHFGIFAISADGDWGNVYYDDITITGPGIPEPTSLAMLSLGGLFIARRRSR